LFPFWPQFSFLPSVKAASVRSDAAAELDRLTRGSAQKKPIAINDGGGGGGGYGGGGGSAGGNGNNNASSEC
jgi:hypothetical protein